MLAIYDRSYALKPAVAAGIAWIATTLFLCLRRPNNVTRSLFFAAYTRTSKTFFNGCMVPFMTNVVRDHKCVEWTDMSASIGITILYKVFNGMQEIVDVLFVTSMNPKIYLVLVACDVAVSCVSTVRYIRAKTVPS